MALHYAARFACILACGSVGHKLCATRLETITTPSVKESGLHTTNQGCARRIARADWRRLFSPSLVSELVASTGESESTAASPRTRFTTLRSSRPWLAPPATSVKACVPPISHSLLRAVLVQQHALAIVETPSQPAPSREPTRLPFRLDCAIAHPPPTALRTCRDCATWPPRF